MDDELNELNVNPRVNLTPNLRTDQDAVLGRAATVAVAYLKEKVGADDSERLVQCGLAAATMVNFYMGNICHNNMADITINGMLQGVNDMVRECREHNPDIPPAAFSDALPLVTAIVIEQWVEAANGVRATALDGALYQEKHVMVPTSQTELPLADGTVNVPIDFSQRMN